MDKSPDAFRTISEVAEHLETPAHVLRFWESRFPQIRPVKRAGGRRYYRPSDVSLLMGIKRLLHDEGLTIRGVQKILREQGVRHVASLSGEVLADDLAADETYDSPPVEAVVVPLASRPKAPPTQGLTDAMAKAVDTKPPPVPTKAPVAPPLAAEPAQGALWLTPAPPLEFEFNLDAEVSGAGKDDLPDPAVMPQDIEADVAATVQATRQEDKGEVVQAAPPQPAFPESVADADGFDDDDPEEDLVATLASRIRALPADASAQRIGPEFLAITTRLQALRDRMASAARPGRS